MKKLSLFLLVSVFAFCGCSDDDGNPKDGDKKEVIISFENRLTEAESEFISTSTEKLEYYFKDTFNDPQNYVTFDHYYNDWGQGYSFAGFTYTNKTSHISDCQPNCGSVKTGNVYMGVYSDNFTPATLSIIKSQYTIKGVWITNSKNAYIGMTEGDGWATAFKKGSWYEVTATGYNDKGNKVAEATIKLADYKSDTDKPVNTWIWFDLTDLQAASKITFTANSSDSDDENGMRTGKYFCIDDLTLIEK